MTGILALGTASSYDDANRGRTPERADELRSRGQAFNVTTDVLLGTTIIAAAVTAYLYVTRPEKEASSLTAFLRTAR